MRAGRFFLPGFVSAWRCSRSVPALASGRRPQRHPEYSLSIVEGESTLPEDSDRPHQRQCQPKAKVAVSIVRGGVEVARTTGNNGDAWLSQVPQVGDVVKLESPNGTPVRLGRSTTVCPRSTRPYARAPTNFSGQRSAWTPVEGGYYTLMPHRSLQPLDRGSARGQAQVTVLVGIDLSPAAS